VDVRFGTWNVKNLYGAGLLKTVASEPAHNEELHNLYATPDIIRVIKSKSMRWAGHVVRMGEMRNATIFGWKT
jgi:hypothetical protein